MWDLQTTPRITGKRRVSQNGPSAEVVSFSPDDTLLATPTENGVDIATVPALSTVARVAADLENISGVVFSPPGNVMALPYSGGIRLVGRIKEKWETVGDIAVVGSVESVQFSADGRRLLAAVADHAELWDVREPQEPRPVARKIPRDEDTAVLLSADGQRVFTVVDDQLIRTDAVAFDAPADGAVLADLAETLGRAEVTEIGRTKALERDESAFRSILNTRCLMERGGACRVAAWLAQPQGQETISPLSLVTVRSYLQHSEAHESAAIWTNLATLFPLHPALGKKPPDKPAESLTRPH
jgi:hypothetical protein